MNATATIHCTQHAVNQRTPSSNKQAAGEFYPALPPTTTTTTAFGKTVTTKAPGLTDFACDVGYLGMVVTSHSFPKEGGLTQPQFVAISDQALKQVIGFDEAHGDPPKSKASILVKETGLSVLARKTGAELAHLPIEEIMSFRRDLSPASRKRKGVAAIVLAKSPNNRGLVCHRLIFKKKANMETFFSMLHRAFADVFRITGRDKGAPAMVPSRQAPEPPQAPAPAPAPPQEQARDNDSSSGDDDEEDADGEYLECGSSSEAWGVTNIAQIAGLGIGAEGSAC